MTPDVFRQVTETIENSRTYADKDRTRLRRDTREDWSCPRAGDFLLRNNGTIDWKGPGECDFGYNSIWEYCAGEFHGAGKKAMDKAAEAQKHAVEMEQGFFQLKQRLFQEHGLVLLAVPRTVNTQKIEVITLDPDYVVSTDPDTGTTLTAGEIHFLRDKKLVTGRLKASHFRISGLSGIGVSQQVLNDAVEEVVAMPVPAPAKLALPQPAGAPA